MANLVLIAQVVSVAAGQAHWVAVGGVAPPTASDVLAYDNARDRVVVLGVDAVGFHCLEFDGASWTRSAALAPVSFGISMCYDRARQATILLTGSPTETWEWRGQSWSLVTVGGPPAFGYAPMVFHNERGTIMRFGGLQGVSGGPGTSNELWELVGSSWQQIPDPNPPPFGYVYTTLAYDAFRDKLVVYGFDNGPAPLQPTWEWDANVGWQAGAPIGPDFVARRLAYDESRRTMIVMGYYTGFPPFETWERASPSTSWVMRAHGPQGIAGRLAYDERNGRVLMMGASLYAYEPVYPAPFGGLAPGCPGSLGIPTQSLASPWTRAWLGESLTVNITGLPNSAAIQILGFSSTTSGSLPLPADLASYGAPGCQLHVAVDGYSVLTNPMITGQAVFTAAVPNNLALRGLAYYLQAVVPDPSANAAGLVMSDAIVGLIGSR